MKIWFSPSMDSPGWPLLPCGKKAVAGEVLVGMNRLLNILETIIGTGQEILPLPVRAAALVPVLGEFCENDAAPYYKNSFSVDPYGVARSLICMRDGLIMAGFSSNDWTHDSTQPRLRDLAQISDAVLPGLPDRLANVIRTLEDYDGEIPDVNCMLPKEQLDLVWKQLLDLLEENGASVKYPGQVELNDCPGEILILKAIGSNQAAEDIASWLYPLWKQGKSVVIVSGDTILDAAFRRYGLPCSGAGTCLTECVAAQVLPLTIAMGWSPPDPETVLEFLYCPLNPLPSFMRDMLAGAISQWPAAGSPAWNENVKKALDSIKNETDRNRYYHYAEILFSTGNAVKGNEYTMSEISKRLDLLEEWISLKNDSHDTSVQSVIDSCSIFRQMLNYISQPSLSRPLLEKLLFEAVAFTQCPALHEPQAGIAFTDSPAAIHGQADIIIWWNFTEDAAPSAEPVALFQKEYRALGKKGVLLPSAVDLAKREIDAWHRPLRFAKHTLLLSCVSGVGGEEKTEHPLWGEIDVSEEFAASRNVVTYLEGQTKYADCNSQPLPVAAKSMCFTPDKFADREQESYSSLATLFSCPFKWLVDYVLKIQGSSLSGILDPERAAGNLVHELIEEVLATEPLLEPEAAGTMAESLFRDKAPQLVATLFQPGMEVELEKMINWLRTAAQHLVTLLQKAHASGISIEKDYEGIVHGMHLFGRPDIVIEKPASVIDIKLYSSRVKKEAMENNTALQPAIYAGLVANARNEMPAAGYFFVNTPEFILNTADIWPDAREIPGLDPESLLETIRTTHDHVKGELSKGVARTDVQGRESDDEDMIDDGTGLFRARRSCEYCGWDALCGRRFVL